MEIARERRRLLEGLFHPIRGCQARCAKKYQAAASHRLRGFAGGGSDLDQRIERPWRPSSSRESTPSRARFPHAAARWAALLARSLRSLLVRLPLAILLASRARLHAVPRRW